jgi:signal transduction histidine kinase
MERAREIEVLVRFSRMISGAATPADILPLLADAAVEHVRCHAAAVLVLGAEGDLELAAERDAPDLRGFRADADAVGHELDAQVRAAYGRDARTLTLPLVSAGDLFGVLVLLCDAGEVLDEDRAALAGAIADLAGIALGRARQLEELTNTNAELRASREALAQSEKLRALGQMATGVAHDLKNILNPLSLHAQLLERMLKGNADALESVAQIRQTIKRGVETIDRLRDFARKEPVHARAALDLRQVAQEAIALWKPRLSSRASAKQPSIQLVEQLSGTPPVEVESTDVINATVNLMTNALDAMPEGGHITISTGVENGQAFVAVKDDGPGMAPDLAQRVFEPFFTTKGAEGTGLGLAMVYGCMQRHRGKVALDTAPGKGTTVTLLFPLP